MTVKFLDLKKINKRFENNLKKIFDNFLNSDKIVLGEQTKLFEKNFANYVGTKYCIGTGSGFDALYLIFQAFLILGKLKKYDEIIVPANTYIATIIPILLSGLKPVLTEPDIHTYNITAKNIEEKITSKTKAIVVVHLYGRIANMIEIKNVAKKYNLLLIEDSAQAHGTSLNDIKAGNWSDASAFSFYPTKNLGALGEAGCITTNNTELANIIKQLRNYGFKEKNNAKYIGTNSRMDEIQAAVLNLKLNFLDKDNEKKRQIAEFFLKNIKNKNIILPAKTKNPQENNWHIFPVRVKNREKLIKYLSEKGIQTAIHYPIPPYKQDLLKNIIKEKFAVSDQIHNEILSLPISPVLTEQQVHYIVETINKYCAKA